MPTPIPAEPALTAACLRFTAEVLTPIVLGEHKGAAVRGALFQAMLRFCPQPPPQQADCPVCPLQSACPVAELMATLRPGERRGRDAPRPYTIEPPLELRSEPGILKLEKTRTRYEPGERFTFGLTLIGKAVDLLPYPVLAAAGLEQAGLGRRIPQPDGRFRRGTLRLEAIEACHPLDGRSQAVLRPGEQMVRTPGIPVTHADVLAAAGALAGRPEMTLEFLSPLRLVDRGELVRRIAFRPLFQRLLERLTLLFTHFAGQDPPYDAHDLIARAGAVEVVADETRWVDLSSFSFRQGRSTPIGGLIGQATFSTTDWEPLLPWLLWGQVVHVGKDAVKGNGWYRII